MDFLLEDGLSKELIDQIEKKYDDAIIDQFILEEENVHDVIRYFKKIGIHRIDTLLLTRIEVFMKDINDVKDAFLRHNIKQMVEEINKDINNIDYV